MSINTKLSSEVRSEQVPNILLIGVNHKTADISTREKLHFNTEQSREVLELLKAVQGIDEASLLCTCNRTEVCIASSVGINIVDDVCKIISDVSKCRDFSKSLYVYQNEQAISHVFEVACGLDSLIPGEQQITAQQKSSYLMAKELGLSGYLLNRLYQRAFGISKKVRSQTAIGRKAVSVSFAAKELSKQIFGDLSEVSVMLIGAGTTGTLAAKYFKSAGVKKFFVVNRTIEKAVELAKNLGGQAADLENFYSLLPLADIVIGASIVETGNYIINSIQLKKSLKTREGVAQFFIDLGVPRNFDSNLSQISDVFLYTLDDLEKVVAENINSRTMEFDRARLIINEEVASFIKWLDNLNRVESIKELVSYCEKLAHSECEKTMTRLRKAGFAASQSSELKMAVDALANALLSKIMHFPIKAIRENNPEDVLREFIRKTPEKDS